MASKAYVVGNGNVFEDLGYPRPAEAWPRQSWPARIEQALSPSGA